MEVKNIKTGVVKTLKNDMEVAMYLDTKEWILVKEDKKEAKKEEKEEISFSKKAGFSSKK